MEYVTEAQRCNTVSNSCAKSIYILGIGGTFMSALAILAKAAGFKVTGCDANCYPPISDLLQTQGIAWTEGYEDTAQALRADCVIVGNAMRRGMPIVEAILNARQKFISGPQWLAENILSRYRVLAVAGTHGKTTTTAMLAFILEQAGLAPGFLIGGVAANFNTNAHLGSGVWFVIEADEYDCAFFDKRPKLMHYHPEIAILNNLEFDHADIYPNLAAIQQQLHYYLRTIPSNGVVLKPRDDLALNQVLAQGKFSRIEELALSGDATWRAEILNDKGQAFRVWHQGKSVAEVSWPLIGSFNIENGLAAIAASYHAGVEPEIAADALCNFKPVKRRLEIKAQRYNVTIYDDFAHHPTAIAKVILALKNTKQHKRILAVLEFASYTMKTGIHAASIGQALTLVDYAYILQPENADLRQEIKGWHSFCQTFPSTNAIVTNLIAAVEPGDGILVMSNRGFDNIHQQLITQLDLRFA